MARKIPDAAPLTGAEAAIVFQDGKAVRTTTQDVANRGPTKAGPKGDQGPPGPKGDTGPAGKDGVAGAKGDQGPAGAKGDTGAAGKDGAAGAKGDKGDKGDTGAAGAPKRVERYSGSTASTGIATITFSPAFESTPDVDVIEGWSGEQMITGAVVAGSITKTSCQVQVMVSRATLLLSTGPFQKAGAGVSITVRAISN